MKIKLPSLKSGAPRRPPKLKLKASVARSRRAPIIEEDDEYFDEPEPNMKLSHAFVVVLVLHVIAVAGVFAFNTIKTKQDAVLAATKPDAIPAPEAGVVEEAAAIASNPAPAPAAAPTAPAQTGPRKHVMMAGETLTKIAAKYNVTVAALQAVNNIEDPTKLRIGTSLTIPEPGTEPAPEPAPAVASAPNPAPAPVAQTQPKAPAASAVTASETIYEVVKGDNPVTIAKKFNVSQAALMELNGIEDPRKLQIGQKLKIPTSN